MITSQRLLTLLCLLLPATLVGANNNAASTSSSPSYDDGSSIKASALFTRYDRKAYFTAAGFHTIDDNDESQSSARAIKYDNLDKDMIQQYLLLMRQRQHIKNKSSGGGNPSSNSDDDPNKCTTYLAPSSIPNSGLGMYTTIPYAKGELFPLPEIGIMLHDRDAHYPFGLHNLLAQYPWGGSVLRHGLHDATSTSCMVPGLGMLANSHLGLVNMRYEESWQIDMSKDGTDSLSVEGQQSSTLQDVGRGSMSLHSRVLFEAYKEIEVGEELFVNYGDEWFTAREDLIGVIPGASDYEKADIMIAKAFSSSNDEMSDGNNYSIGSQVYEEMLNDAEKDGGKRLRAAFPDHFTDVPDARKMGTARFSAKTSIQSVEWIENNGACIDNIVVGTSTIPQAGRGAFATRSIKEGGVITTTPLITLEREQLQLWEEVNAVDVGVQTKQEDDKVLEMVGYQLLLNYCYGHVNSSLILFPYSPSVNFINHGSIEDANAVIRWSSYPYHKGEWLDLSVKEIKDLQKTGLMFDVLATRDIHRGEEVLLYYGKDWEDSWNVHIEEWFSASKNEADAVMQKNVTDTLGIPTTVDFNERRNPDSIIWTVEEQKRKKPYPDHFETVCRFDHRKADEKCQDTESNDYCEIRWTYTWNYQHDHPCDIISRATIDGTDWYSARMSFSNSSTNEMKHYHIEFMPQYAIRLMHRKYARDQYSHGVFREVIGLPVGLYPDHWMDLNDEADDENFYKD